MDVMNLRFIDRDNSKRSYSSEKVNDQMQFSKVSSLKIDTNNLRDTEKTHKKVYLDNMKNWFNQYQKVEIDRQGNILQELGIDLTNDKTTILNGKFLVSNRIVEPYSKGDIQTAEDLSLIQKTEIIGFNLIEIVFVGAQFTAVVMSQSVLVIPYYLIVLGVIMSMSNNIKVQEPQRYQTTVMSQTDSQGYDEYLLDRGSSSVDRKPQMWKHKLQKLFSNSVLMISAIKIVYIFTSINNLSPEELSQDTRWQTITMFGFSFSNRFKLNIFMTFYAEITMLISSISLTNLYSKQRYLYITRKVHVTSILKSQKSVEHKLEVNMIISDRKRKKDDGKTLSIDELIFDHPYFIKQAVPIIFYALLILMAIDMATYQNLIQLSICLLLLVCQIQSLKKGPLREKVKSKFSQGIIWVSKATLILQLTLIWIVNIQAIFHNFWNPEYHNLEKIFQYCGAFIGDFDEKSDSLFTPEYTDILNNFQLLYHVMIASAFIILASIYQSVLRKYAYSQRSEYCTTSQTEQNHQIQETNAIFDEALGDIKRIDTKTTSRLNANLGNVRHLRQSEQPNVKQNLSRESAGFVNQNQTFDKINLGKAFQFTVDIDSQDEIIKSQNNYNTKQTQHSQYSKSYVVVRSVIYLHIMRFNSIIIAYMYHDWFAIFNLIFVTHSFLYRSIKRFKTSVKWFHLPMVTLVISFYILINTNGNYEMIKMFDQSTYGFFKMQNPHLEISFLLFNQFIWFAWLKSLEWLELNDDSYLKQSLNWVEMMSSEKSTLAQSLIVLIIPCFEKYVHLFLLINGMNSSDLNHVLSLFIFVALCIRPQWKKQITELTIVYAMVFIIAQYIFTIAIQQAWIGASDILQGHSPWYILNIIGITTKYIWLQEQWTLFQYTAEVAPWIFVYSAYFQLGFIYMQDDEKDTLQTSIANSKKNIQKKLPRIYEFCSRVQMLQRLVVLTVTFATFYIILVIRCRNLIDFMLLILTNVINYTYLNRWRLHSSNACMWRILQVFSGLVILSNMTYIFVKIIVLRYGGCYLWQNRLWQGDFPIDNVGDNDSLCGLKEDKMCTPCDSENKYSFIGFVDYDGTQTIDMFIEFLPRLTFFVFSSYMIMNQEQWHKQEAEIEEKLGLNQNLNQSQSLIMSQFKGYTNEVKTMIQQSTKKDLTNKSSELIKKELLIEHAALRNNLIKTQKTLKDKQDLLKEILLSGYYFSYKSQKFWPYLDKIAEYFNLVLLLAIILINTFNWFNLVNVLLICCYIVLFMSMGFDVYSESNIKKSSKLDKMTDQDFLTAKKQFDMLTKRKVLEMRYYSWKCQFCFVIFASTCLYGIPHCLNRIVCRVDENGTPDQDCNNQVWFLKLKYFMYICGIYISEEDRPEGYYCEYCYVCLFTLITIERMCIEWLQNKFLVYNLELINHLSQSDKNQLKGLNVKDQELTKFHIKEHKIKIQQNKICQSILQLEKKIEQDKSLIKHYNHRIQNFERELKLLMRRKLRQLKNSDLTFGDEEPKQPQSSSIIKSDEKALEKLKESLIVSTDLKLLRGLKMFLEETIMFLMLCSCILRLNIVSLVQFVLILLRFVRHTQTTFNMILVFYTFFFGSQLMMILSNMTHNTNPMKLPKDLEPILNPNYTSIFPWIANDQRYLKNQSFTEWIYFMQIIQTKQNLKQFILDFFIILLNYTYFITCQFWGLKKNIHVSLSSATMTRLKTFIIQNQIKNSMGNFLQQKMKNDLIDLKPRADPTSDQNLNLEIKAILKKNMRYRYFKSLQRLMVLKYPKYMVIIVLLLSIQTNTIVSLVYATSMCALIFSNELFYDFEKARTILRPFLKYFLQTYALFHILTQLVFQIPGLLSSDQINQRDSQKIINNLGIFGIEKYETVKIDNSSKSIVVEKQNTSNVNYDLRYGKVYIIAAIYYVISLYLRVITSQSFQRLESFKSLGILKGNALSYQYNNLKIKSYCKFQEMNEKKKIMMEKVREICYENRMKILKAQDRYNFSQDDLYSQDEKKAKTLKQTDTGTSLLLETPDQNRQRTQVSNKNMSQDLDKIDEMNDSERAFEEQQKMFHQKMSTVQKISSIKGSLRTFNQRSIYKKDFQSSEKETERDDGYYEGQEDIQYDYLTIKILSLQKIKNEKKRQEYRQSMWLNDEMDLSEESETSSINDYKQQDFLSSNQNIKTIFQRKIRGLPVLVRLYIYLRRNLINPIILINDRERIKQILEATKKGGTRILSSIEIAIIQDIEYELVHGQPTEKEMKLQIPKSKMFRRYLKLIYNIVDQNLEVILYLTLVSLTIVNPGIVTVFFPFAIFGYAILCEPRPPQCFFKILMVYVQAIMLVEFLLSLTFWQENSYTLKIYLAKILKDYYVGITLVDYSASTLEFFFHFMPHMISIYCILDIMSKQKMLDLHELQEHQKESMYEAYDRYIENKFNKQLSKTLIYNSDNNCPQVRGSIILDEFGRSRLKRRTKSCHGLDQKHFVNSNKKVKIIQDVEIYNKSLMKSQGDKASQSHESIAKQKKMKIVKDSEVKKCCSNLLTGSGLMRRIFPRIKMMKPGRQYYQQILIVQIIQCFFILFFYSKISKKQQSLIEQIQTNQFAGNMVLALILQILIMVVDRFIYKSWCVIDQEQTQAEIINKEIVHKAIINEQEYTQEQALKGDKLNTSLLITQQQIHFSSVSKFYFQWVTLILCHGILFINKPDFEATFDEDNDSDAIFYVNLFYILGCVYFLISALQIRYGQPEQMQTFFMMGNFSTFNRRIFYLYMAAPILFELRVIIDWCCTSTALNIFQWMKLAKIQADLFTAKSQNGSYHRKPLGKSINTKYQKLSGWFLIFSIIVLIIGPLVLFSSILSFIGTTQPALSAKFALDISVVDSNGTNETGQMNLFTQSTLYQMRNLTQDQYNKLYFDQVPSLKSQYKDYNLFQYGILDEPKDSWFPSKAQSHIIRQKIDEIVTKTESGTDQKNLPQIKLKLSYEFTRKNPTYAQNPKGAQKFIFDNSNQDAVRVLKNISNILQFNDSNRPKEDSCMKTYDGKTGHWKYGPGYLHSGSLKQFFKNNSEFQPMLLFDLTENIKTINNMTSDIDNYDSDYNWNKDLFLRFNACSQFPVWRLQQHIDTNQLEYVVMNETIEQYDSARLYLSFFIGLTKVSYIQNQNISYLYIFLGLVIAKYFRQLIVPIIGNIHITDAKDPEYLLTLCDTIHLHRLKKQLAEEEKMYFLLIEILRSPSIIYKLTGSSIKDQKEAQKQDETAQLNQTHSRIEWKNTPQKKERIKSKLD